MTVSAPSPSFGKSTEARPRLLVVLALLGFFYAAIGCITGWSSVITFTSPHERFTSAMQHEAGHMPDLPQTLGTPDQLERVALRKAEALWSRRGVLLPMAIASIVTSTLMLFGIGGAVMRRLAWGRSAWQLSALLALVGVALEGAFGFVHSRDLVRAVAGLDDPLSLQLPSLLPMRDAMVVTQALVSVAYLAGTAVYLSSARVMRYCGIGARP